MLAIAKGFDALLWLDSDNWFYRDHVETLIELHAHERRERLHILQDNSCR